MAARGEPDVQEVINEGKRALGRQKSQFQRDISNGHKLIDLDRTFNELEKVSEAVLKRKFGPLRHRQKIEITSLYPMLQRIMVHAKNGINRRLTARKSNLHPWKIRFDIQMPQEAFDLLHKGIIITIIMSRVDTFLYLIALLLEPPDSLF